MKDYYKTLGITPSASQDEIKKAYRGLAMKHHPDRGGDQTKFQEIQEAYNTLSDENLRAQHDNPGQNFNFGGDDMFGSFFGGPFGGFQFRSSPRNANVTAVVDLSLEEVLHGKTIDAEVGFKNGGKKLVSINIPPGVDDGIQIRYPGMGDHSISKLSPGDLIVQIRIRPHSIWKRLGQDIICDKEISVWDCILGTTLNVNTLDNKTFTVNVPAGTQPDTTLSCKGEGLPHPNTMKRGNLLIRIKVQIPKNLTDSQLNIIKKFQNNDI
jgi:DnaJ-class molecular chaperone